jgi:hypothetical protein
MERINRIWVKHRARPDRSSVSDPSGGRNGKSVHQEEKMCLSIVYMNSGNEQKEIQSIAIH